MRRGTKKPAALLVLGLSLLPLAGCAKKKVHYDPPVSNQLVKAGQWNTPLEGGATAKPAGDETLSRWWARLNDPVLTSLEERALKGNLDIRKAVAVIRQVRAGRNSATADRLPTVTGSASASGGRSGSKSGGPSAVSQSYNAGLDVSWEPDFFGRVSQTVQAYDADLGAAQEDLRDVLVSLTAEVAVNYIDARSYQAQLAIAKASLESQQSTYELAVAKYESGLATELDVVQALQTVESTRAQVPALESGLRQSVNAIAVLLGERPGAVDAELADAKPVPVIPSEIAVGLPADLVRRRPDIRSAERQVAAQTARLGVAYANLAPSFSLTGSLGLNSITIANLFTPSALAMNAVGSMTQTIFNRRKLRENVNIQDAVLEQKLAAYESTVLTALQEVENALVALAKEQVRRKSLADATAAAERSLTLSRDLYSAGLKDFLNVLEAERSLLTLKDQLAQSDATITANLVQLYKALGGGWDPNAPAR